MDKWGGIVFGARGLAPERAPLIDPVPVPAGAVGVHWQHVLLESRVRRSKWETGDRVVVKHWVWALLLSSPEPIESLSRQHILPSRSVVTAIFGGELQDAAGMRDVMSASLKGTLDAVPVTIEGLRVSLTVEDETVLAGMCQQFTNDPHLALAPVGAVQWSTFADGRATLLGLD